MKIGVDIDEVLADHLGKLIEFYHHKTGKLVPREKFTTYKWWVPWGITREEAIQVDNEFKHSPLFDSVVPVKNAVKSVKSLLEKDKLFIITSRHTIYKEKTASWIKRHFGKIPVKIIHSGDFFKGGSKTKAEICKDLGVGIMLEDAGSYAFECASLGIKAILFDNPWNQGFKHRNLIRVDDWVGALKEIEKIRAKKG